MSDTWDDLHRCLTEALAALTDGEFLTVSEPPGEFVKRGFLRRGAPAPTRFVQFVVMGDEVRAECSGADSFGGSVHLTDVEVDLLRAIGWLLPTEPGDIGAEPPSYPNFWRAATRASIEVLVALGVGALTSWGLDPGTLEWKLG